MKTSTSLMMKVIFVLLFQTMVINHLFAAEQPVQAEVLQENPAEIIRKATTGMLGELSLKQQEIEQDPSIVMGIVENLLIPHFATNTISRKVLGRHIKKISKEQKQLFAEAFRFYMVRYYAKIFAAYSNQTFKYLAVPNYAKKKKVRIKTQLIQAGAKPVSIDYIMQRSGKSWKIIDLKIEGISMVISNKKQFGSQISRDGIDTVIAKLQYKNEKSLTHD